MTADRQMQSRVLVTGFNGFTGRHMVDELARAGYEIHGMARSAVPSHHRPARVDHVADLSDAEAVARVVGDVMPHKVVHLAGIAAVAAGAVDRMYSVHIQGTRNLLEALVARNVPVDAVLLTSSASVYGDRLEGAIKEDDDLRPVNDYGVSKLAMELLSNLYQSRLPIIVARPFNYTGVGQTEDFLIPKIVDHARRQAAFIELGNLDVARDFSDVRAVVEIYRRLLECPGAVGSVVNVCSGAAHSLRWVLEAVAALTGRTTPVHVNPRFVRPNEVRWSQGSKDRLTALIGETRPPALSDTLRWMLGA